MYALFWARVSRCCPDQSWLQETSDLLASVPELLGLQVHSGQPAKPISCLTVNVPPWFLTFRLPCRLGSTGTHSAWTQHRKCAKRGNAHAECSRVRAQARWTLKKGWVGSKSPWLAAPSRWTLGAFFLISYQKNADPGTLGPVGPRPLSNAGQRPDHSLGLTQENRSAQPFWGLQHTSSDCQAPTKASKSRIKGNMKGSLGIWHFVNTSWGNHKQFFSWWLALSPDPRAGPSRIELEMLFC